MFAPCPRVTVPACPLATFGRAQATSGSAIQGYGLTPRSERVIRYAGVGLRNHDTLGGPLRENSHHDKINHE